MDTAEMMRLCDVVRETAYAVHAYHGNGYLEKVYENALANRLRRAGLRIVQRYPIVVHDEDNSEIGDYYADILVNDCLLVELKACKTLTSEHQSQLLHYLKATGVEHGLLINFGSYRFEIKKFVRTQDPATTTKERKEHKEAR